LCRIAELNHSVRNSLEVIVLAHYSEADLEHKGIVLECTDRIDQKLRELFPAIANPETGKRKVAGNRGSGKNKKPGRNPGRLLTINPAM
jgi:hypothetical protein